MSDHRTALSMLTCFKRPHAQLLACVVWACAVMTQPIAAAELDMQRGICVVLGLPGPGERDIVKSLVDETEVIVYFQSEHADDVAKVRSLLHQGGLLGSRVFVDQGEFSSINLADNLAGAVIVSPDAKSQVEEQEVLRVLHPEGVAIIGDKRFVKQFPEGSDDWSHPYHGPDNNPQSLDENIPAPYLTQFLAGPKFSPMPEVTVASGGRVFRACGHIAHKKNQNQSLNTLFGINGYNGTILWKRPLSESFMIHRNTMIATPDILFMADDESCKMIDARTGKLTDEIIIDDSISAGKVWKWMAMVDGVLYALIGGEESPIKTQEGTNPALGHWPWGMWDGHDYSDPATSFGFGQVFVAIDPETKKILWRHREREYLDCRGVCMTDGKIYAYSPEKFLACIRADDGEVYWKNTDLDLLTAIGPGERAQHYITGYSTSAYIKCKDEYILFAGPQRPRLVVASADDGRLLWTKDHGNYQLVLRDESIYAAGPQFSPDAKVTDGPRPQGVAPPTTSMQLDYTTGEVLAEHPLRRACTRATATLDSVFYRTPGGTIRMDMETSQAKHIAPMRPPCQDGVIVSDGHLYWGPWMCGCQLSFYGHICLGAAGDFDFRPGLDDSRLTVSTDGPANVAELNATDGDWLAYQGNNARQMTTSAVIPEKVAAGWTYAIADGATPTAPVAAGGLVFFGDRHGVVRAIDATDGSLAWQTYTAGPVYYPPAIENSRLYVGSADGRVYALEATTGRVLWTFQAAPSQRRISVYEKLISTWPVAGGVVVEDGTVYAAAGIAHYDGIHVYALDSVSGEVKWYNDTSGTISELVESGVSLQGNLHIRDGELRFLGGGAHEFARYDLATGECLNSPNDRPQSSYHTAFEAYYPDYDKYVSLEHTLSDGRELVYDVTYEGSWHSPLAMFDPLPEGTPKIRKTASRWAMPRRRDDGKRKPLWQLPAGARFNSFVVSPDVLLAAAHTGLDATDTSVLSAVRLDDGKPLWIEKLPGEIVKGGAAVDSQSRILVSLTDGRVLCFAKP